MTMTPSNSQTLELEPTIVHHHHSYNRTKHLTLCTAVDYFMPNESNADCIPRVLFDNNDNPSVVGINPNLKLFNFNFPKKFADIMHGYYLADDRMDDTYEALLSNNDRGRAHDERDYRGSSLSDGTRACLAEAVTATERQSNALMYAVAYMHPNIATFYRSADGQGGDAGTGCATAGIGTPVYLSRIYSLVARRRLFSWLV